MNRKLIPRIASRSWLALLLAPALTVSVTAFAQDQSPPLLPTAEVAAGLWRFTTQLPADGWMNPGFDDHDWKQGQAGFGSQGTPNALIGTEWTSADIWLRREFDLPAGKLEPQMLRWHHDDDAEVFLNGKFAARQSGYLTGYENTDLSADAEASLKPGKNLVAIHCHQFAGGQYIDAGLVKGQGADLGRYGDQNETEHLSEGNPIVPGLFADPSIAKFGDTYYLYSTTDGFGWRTGRWVVWKSKDFVHWSFKGESFPEITAKYNYAPGVPVFRNGRYWLPYTLLNKGYIGVGDAPEGPFHDALGTNLVDDIDSEFFIDDDGTAYFVWGRPVQSICRLQPDFSALVGPVTRFDFHQGYVEGPFLVKRKGIYYLCGANLGMAEYRINYAMGESPTGSFRVPPDNFLVKPDPAHHLWGTGHGNVLKTGADEWALIYLRSRMDEKVDPFKEGGNVYCQVCADRISFNADGTMQRHGPTREGIGLLAPSTEHGTSLALGKTASASSSLRRYGPEKAVDGGFGTRWIVGDTSGRATWWQVDLGAVCKVARTEISFNYPTEITPYQLLWSTDGTKWNFYADHGSDKNYESPKVDRKPVKARFLRVVFAAAVTQGIPAGLWEFKAFDQE